jgi:hypothetical protein
MQFRVATPHALFESEKVGFYAFAVVRHRALAREERGRARRYQGGSVARSLLMGMYVNVSRKGVGSMTQEKTPDGGLSLGIVYVLCMCRHVGAILDCSR